MKFSDFILEKAVVTDFKATDKTDAVVKMVQALAAAGGIPQDETETVSQAILSREECGSTGLGGRVAVPHTKHQSVEKPVGLVAICPNDGVPFDALDGENVNIFFLLISPPDLPGDHLRALEYITRQIKVEGLVKLLMQARTPEDAIQILKDSEAETGAANKDGDA